MALTQDLATFTVPHIRFSQRCYRCDTGSSQRGFVTSIAPFSLSVCYVLARSSNSKHVPYTGGPLSSQKANLEKLWREFFCDPSQWWDHRPEKANPKYPDFKHKKTQHSLWLNNILIPSWVEAELAAMAPVTLQSNIFSWNTKLRRNVNAGNYKEVMDLFQELQREGMIPDKFTFVPVLKACSCLLALEEGRLIHLQIIKSNLDRDVYVGSALVDMYAKFGSIDNAQKVFSAIPTKDVVCWNAMILGLVKCGQGQGALQLFRLMQQEEVDLSPVTFVGVLNACASIGALEEGRLAHEQVICRRYQRTLKVANSLIDMYAKCGSIEDAHKIFNQMTTRDVVSWSALILGYVKCGKGQEALVLSRQMQLEEVELDTVTFVGVLNACASIEALEQGRCFHEQIIDRGYECDVYVASALVDMYAKCGSIEDAKRVFDNVPTRNVVSFNALIMGYVKCGQGQDAFELWQQMQRDGVELDPVTFVGVLTACASIGALERGRHVHEQIIKRGYEFHTHVAGSLVDMYAKCGSIGDAQRVFDKMTTKDLVSRNALILGYVKCGQGHEALKQVRIMQDEGLDLSIVTFIAVFNACASIGALEEGRRAHVQIMERGYDCDLYVANSLIDMYAKCGSIEDAQRVFDKMPTRGVVSWNAMLAGYCWHGYVVEALDHFERMCQERKVDATSFVSILSACSHGGLVDEGMRYFQSMGSVYQISPTLENYACVVDLLGRAGYLHEAEDLIKGMPCEPDAAMWMSLLGACRIHGNVEIGQHVAERVLVLDPGNSSCYILLSYIYAAAGKWDRVEAVYNERMERDVNGMPGHTWIELNSKVHSFAVNDSNHPQINEIHAELERLSVEMKDTGYVAVTRFRESESFPWHAAAVYV